MNQSKEVCIKVVEFYLKNLSFINRQIEYRLQSRNTSAPITINKLYKPIPFEEIYSISHSINNTLATLPEEKSTFVDLRYRKNCTYDVICGLLCMKRSTLFNLGAQTLDDFLFNLMLDDLARNNLLKANMKCYFLSNV